MDHNQTEAYRRRFQTVTEHIERHLDDDLSLERLSAVAHFRPFTFIGNLPLTAACRWGVTSSCCG